MRSSLLLLALTLGGCTLTRQATLPDRSDRSLGELNRLAEGRNVSVTLLRGERHWGSRLAAAADSIRWETDAGPRAVATDSVWAVTVHGVGGDARVPLGLGAAAGAALAAVALVDVFDDEDEPSPAGKVTAVVLGVPALVIAGIAAGALSMAAVGPDNAEETTVLINPRW